MTSTRRRRACTAAGLTALLVAGSAATASGAGAAPGFQPVQPSPTVPAVSRKDIPWTIADPAFDYSPTTGQGAAFTPLVDEAGAPRTRILTGIDAGASYRIEVPLTGWNGDVVFWEHGYRGTGTTLYVDSPAFDLRTTYADAGYAWAASSYTANRYDIQAGMWATERLATVFDKLVAPADDRYLQGVSMGGHIIGGLVQRQAVDWAGAAPMCGVMGDLLQFDYPVDYNLVAQSLAGVDAFPFSTPEEYSAAIPTIKEKLGLPTSPVGPNPALTRRGQVLRDVVIDLTGGPRPGAKNAFTFWEGQTFSLGRFADDPIGSLGGVTAGRVGTNADTLYPTSFAFPDGTTLNSRVERVAAAPGTRAPGGPITLLDAGRITVPVLSVHTLGDLFVPFQHERLYAAEAQQAGTAGLLVQRAMRAAGHCEFTPEEAAQTFSDLTSWVESVEAGTPVRPAGDDVLNRTTVARSDFGCRFSAGVTPTRALFPACPTPSAP